MRVTILLSMLFLIVGCNATDEAAYTSEIENWKTERLAELKQQDGFLSLAGLFWLERRFSTFGSNSENDMKFPRAFAAQAGTFVTTADNLVVLVPMDTTIKVKDTSQSPDTIFFQNDAKIVSMGSYEFGVIERAGSLAVRLRNLAHPNLSRDLVLDYFPTDPKWRIEAKFVPYEKDKKLTILNVIGQLYDVECPGKLEFTIEKKEFTLDVTVEEDKYFVIFADQSTGAETYDGGRYLYTYKEDKDGVVILDFNKAYNPPCVFSDFATCPLPPMQNKLEVNIVAGEKKFSWE
jgi:uncharacterized protein (DUF1684 family)